MSLFPDMVGYCFKVKYNDSIKAIIKKMSFSVMMSMLDGSASSRDSVSTWVKIQKTSYMNIWYVLDSVFIFFIFNCSIVLLFDNLGRDDSLINIKVQ